VYISKELWKILPLVKHIIVSALASAARRLKRRPRYTPPLLAPHGHELKDMPRCGAMSYVTTKAATLQGGNQNLLLGQKEISVIW
jgi:hypothetical protein